MLPDGSLKLASIEQSNRRIFRKGGYEERGTESRKSKQYEEQQLMVSVLDDMDIGEPLKENVDRSRRRALNNIVDIVMSNSFKWFITLTLSPEKVDRTEYQEIERLFSRWASNQVQRKSMKYIAIPEYHADGKSIHYHMLTDGDMKMTDSGHMREGKPVYNVPSWRYGFSTAQSIDGEDNEIKIAKYCTKYMTKNTQKIGGRWYYSGGKLNKPIILYGEAPEEFMGDDKPLWVGSRDGEWGTYRKYTFV